ncbi:MAG: sigma-70 family RNA polymerase sigma factor [Candidatus Kerfeldbacteria bacterium]|nr:sigma-70 family RNA polymerase sigma factor [Candidatus Kerfeldbacteria bacterium]
MEAQPHEDQELIARAQQQPDAFAALYDKYVDRIFQFVYYRTGQHQEAAEDATAEVFTRALKTLPTFMWQGYPYSAYLYSVARSVCQDYYKQRVVEDIETVVVKDERSLSMETQTDIHLLWQRLREFPPEVQEIFELRYLEDLSYDEIAQIVDKKSGAIRTLVSRTIDKLQHTYEQAT